LEVVKWKDAEEVNPEPQFEVLFCNYFLVGNLHHIAFMGDGGEECDDHIQQKEEVENVEPYVPPLVLSVNERNAVGDDDADKYQESHYCDVPVDLALFILVDDARLTVAVRTTLHTSVEHLHIAHVLFLFLSLPPPH